jgi:hypothetical protein
MNSLLNRISPSLDLHEADKVSLLGAQIKKGERAQDARSPDNAEQNRWVPLQA